MKKKQRGKRQKGKRKRLASARGYRQSKRGVTSPGVIEARRTAPERPGPAPTPPPSQVSPPALPAPPGAPDEPRAPEYGPPLWLRAVKLVFGMKIASKLGLLLLVVWAGCGPCVPWRAAPYQWKPISCWRVSERQTCCQWEVLFEQERWCTEKGPRQCNGWVKG
jgi:hypothetical protein